MVWGSAILDPVFENYPMRLWGYSLAEDNRMAVRGGTYLLRDPETEQVMRTGRTKDLERRAREHRRDYETADFVFEVDRRTDVYAQQRGREQILHEKCRPR